MHDQFRHLYRALPLTLQFAPTNSLTPKLLHEKRCLKAPVGLSANIISSAITASIIATFVVPPDRVPFKPALKLHL